MSWWRRVVGTDLVESAIWIVGGILIANLTWEAAKDDVASQGAALGVIIAFAVRRYFLIRNRPPEGETSGAWRVADLESRIAELETLHQRVAELEERVNFSERMLANSVDPARLEAPK